MAGFLMSNPNALPGVGAELVAAIRELLMREPASTDFFPIGAAIDGTKSGDPDNPTGRVDVLRDGMPMGKITATNKYACSLLGQLGVALGSTDTTLKLLTSTEATEIIRRIGASGTFKVTGPPTAAGTVRTLTVTYSAVGAGTGQNEVQTMTPDVAATAGSYRISLRKSDGTIVTTAAIAWNATLAAAQAAVTAALGSAGVVLSTAGSAAPFSAGPIALVLTWSGTGYTKTDQPMATIDVSLLTGVTITTVETTKGIPDAATVTITAAGVNEVQTITLGAAMTAGSIQIGVYDQYGSWQKVTVAFNATWTQTVADIATALNAVLGASSVACAVASATSMTITFSGTGYARLPQSPVLCDVSAATSVTTCVVTRTTPGVDGRFVVGSLIQPTDGSETIVTLLRTGTKTGVSVFNALLARIDVQYPEILCSGFVRSSYILGYAGNDASTKAWIKAQLRANGGKWLFDDDYLGVAV